MIITDVVKQVNRNTVSKIEIGNKVPKILNITEGLVQVHSLLPTLFNMKVSKLIQKYQSESFLYATFNEH